MMPEKAVSRVMRVGLAAGLILMAAGVALFFAGYYSEEVKLSAENLMNGKLLTDGAGLMYLGTIFIILTPVSVLGFLSVYYAFGNSKKYSMYCLLIIAVLIIVVMMRFN